MTIFTEQFAEDNASAIHQVTKCGNLVPIFLDPDTYYGAKATSWEDSLEVLSSAEFPSAFSQLNAGTVEALIMSIPIYLQLKSDTEVVDGEDAVYDLDEQVTIFNETVGI